MLHLSTQNFILFEVLLPSYYHRTCFPRYIHINQLLTSSTYSNTTTHVYHELLFDSFSRHLYIIIIRGLLIFGYKYYYHFSFVR